MSETIKAMAAELEKLRGENLTLKWEVARLEVALRNATFKDREVNAAKTSAMIEENKR
jgi:hypothetical protein